MVHSYYVDESSRECIFKSLDERNAILKYTAEAVKEKNTLIAYVIASSIKDSIVLAIYSASLGYDVLSDITPV